MIETIPKEAQLLDLLGKYFKLSVLKMPDRWNKSWIKKTKTNQGNSIWASKEYQ